jgi:hypothetical protein
MYAQSNNSDAEMAVFWIVAQCSLVEVYQRFRGPCCLHHQGDEYFALKMEIARTSETSVNFYQTTRRYNQEDSHLRIHRRENLKSHLILMRSFWYCLYIFNSLKLTFNIFLKILVVQNRRGVHTRTPIQPLIKISAPVLELWGNTPLKITFNYLESHMTYGNSVLGIKSVFHFSLSYNLSSKKFPFDKYVATYRRVSL